MKLALINEVLPIFCKGKNKFREVVFFRVIYCHKRDFWYSFVCQYIRLLFKGGLFVFKRSLLCGVNKASLQSKEGFF